MVVEKRSGYLTIDFHVVEFTNFGLHKPKKDVWRKPHNAVNHVLQLCYMYV